MWVGWDGMEYVWMNAERVSEWERSLGASWSSRVKEGEVVRGWMAYL